MSKVIFNYGCMGSGKTSKLLTKFNTYKRRNKNPLIIKPCLDDREGNFIGWGVTKSRITKYEAPTVYFKDLEKEIEKLEFGVLFVDEVQFLNRNDILTLCRIADEKDIDVFCYGLKTDVSGNLFEGSKHLLALADEIKEIETLCEIENCSCNAVCHIRYINGKRDYSNKSIAIEKDNITYKSVCRKHWLI